VIDHGPDGTTAPLIVEALRLGDAALFEARLAAMAGLPPAQLRGRIYGAGGRDLAIVCRGLGLERLVFASVLLLSHKAGSEGRKADPGAFAKTMAFYERLPAPAAREIVEQWRRKGAGAG
jgi:hypothetical protein